MAAYVVESYDWQIFHAGVYSDGVAGDGPGSKKLYLHVIAITDEELKQLKAREDEHGNKESDRLALPRNEEWWIAVAGEKVWPKIPRPRIVSHCQTDESGFPRPQPLSADAAEQLRKKGVTLPQ